MLQSGRRAMRECAHCGTVIDETFRFCPGCGRALRTKVVEYFRGDRRLDDGDLRVSVYLTEPQHVRLSVWRNEVAEAALSLEPSEAARLAKFLTAVTVLRGPSLVSAARGAAVGWRSHARRPMRK
jgi:zinc-ribbon domain